MENLKRMIAKISEEAFKKADFANAQSLAYGVIADSKSSTLPINIKKIIKSYKQEGLHLVKYSAFAKKRGLSLADVIYLADSEDGCLWKRDDESYILLYNDTISYLPQVRFTLAHELGHFILGHHNKTDESILSRGGLSSKVYRHFEMEANYFAKRLLAPIPLVDQYTNIWKMNDDLHLRKIFNISTPVSESIINTLNDRMKKTNVILESHKLVENFKVFIHSEFTVKICDNCQSMQNIEKKFCGTCGEKSFSAPDFKNYIKFKDKKVKTMKYKALALDDEGRLAEECPNCKNEDLKGNHCSICGKYIINRCTGIHEENPSWPQEQCEGTLCGADRYCYDCGAKSSFLENGFLPSWDEVTEDLPY